MHQQKCNNCHIVTLSYCFCTVCDVLPLIINNVDMRLPASLLQKYMLKAAEFYIGYVTRGPSPDGQMQGKAALTGAKINFSQAHITVLLSPSDC